MVERARGVVGILALVGPRCAGKSSVGRALARAAQVAWLDSDLEIAREAGEQTAKDVIDRLGLARFRKLEERALARLLKSKDPRVLSTGGGAVESNATRKLLRERSFCVWLDAQPDVLAARMRADPTPRPALLGTTAMEEIAPLRAARQALYQECAHAHIATDDLDVEQVVQRVLRASQGRWLSDHP